MIKKHTAQHSGFTLIETLVAISLLSIAIVGPMTLTSQSLSGAFFARDQVTAYNLAQEGLEAIRAIRDDQIITISQGQSADLFGSLPLDRDFTINPLDSTTKECSGACPVLEISPDGNLYGYGDSRWTPTQFTRKLRACFLQSDGSCNSTVTDELRVTVTVSWPTASGRVSSFTIYQDFYRWIEDGAAQ
jgi:prepilin-type N-terminal cleavage/methylation domain-containing protein